MEKFIMGKVVDTFFNIFNSFRNNNDADTAHGYPVVDNVNEQDTLEARRLLVLLGDKLNSQNGIAIKKLATSVEDISLLESSEDIITATQNLLKTILQDIAKKENIYIEEDFANIIKSQVLEDAKGLQYILNEKVSDIKEYIVHFEEFVDWYVEGYFKAGIMRNKKLTVAKQSELTKQDLNDIYNIETLVYPKEIAGKEEATTIVLENNCHSIAAARDAETKKVIAFICAYPITDNFYNTLMTGNFDDTNITAADIVNYDQPGHYRLYISSYCVHPKYTRSAAFGVVYKSFLQIVEELAHRDIFITEILADTATKKGALLCRSLGMKKETETDHDTVLYKININEANIGKIFAKNKRIMALYGDLL